MRAVIVYATNSGSTYNLSHIIGDVLRKKYDITIKAVSEVTVGHLHSADLLIFGSPSWLVDGVQGMPHPAMLAFFNGLGRKQFPEKKCVVFGAGDSSYTEFCGAVDYLEKLLRVRGAKVVAPGLKIDGFYFDEKHATERARAWAETL